MLPNASVPQPLPSLQLAAGDLAIRDRITCLGVCVDPCGSTQTMVARRLEVATKVWGRWRHLLVSPTPANQARMHNTHETVVASALWGPILWAASS